MKFKHIFLLFIFFSFSLFLRAIFVSGQLVDDKGLPIFAASVSSLSNLNFSNRKGFFKIKIDSYQDSLRFRHISYETKKIIASTLLKNPLQILKIKIISTSAIVESFSKTNEITQIAGKIIIKKNSEVTKLTEEIEMRSSVNITGTNISGESQTLSFSGFNSRHTLVMVDGIVMNNSGESFDLSSIPNGIIESVEIIKGANSAYGGSGSMGGIINIKTKKISINNELLINQSFGSYGLLKNSLHYNFRKNKLNIRAFMNFLSAENEFKYTIIEGDEAIEKYRVNNDKKNFSSLLEVGSNWYNFDFVNKTEYAKFFKKLPGVTNNPAWFWDCRISGDKLRNTTTISKFWNSYEILNRFYWANESSKYDNSRLKYPFN